MPFDKVVISATLFGQLIQNRFYLQTEVFQEVAEVALHVQNSWVNQVRQWQHSNLRYTLIQVTRILDGPPSQENKVVNITGAQTPEVNVPSFVSGVLQFKTNLVGRRFRGRYYWAAPRQGGISGGFHTANESAFIQPTINTLKGLWIGPAGGSTGIQLVIRHADTGGFTAVTDIGLRPTLGCQRRRNIGVGA